MAAQLNGAADPTGVKVVRTGDGQVGGLAPGVGVRFKIDGADTGGGLAIVEHTFVVGSIVPPHIHTRQDEISYVLEGEIGFRSNDSEVVLTAGSYIVKPRGEAHAMWNAGATPARLVEVISPAGFEDYFREVVAMTATGTSTSTASLRWPRVSDCSLPNPNGWAMSSPATS